MIKKRETISKEWDKALQSENDAIAFEYLSGDKLVEYFKGSKEMIRTIKQVAKYVYKTLGPGHEEAIYRDAMSVEL